MWELRTLHSSYIVHVAHVVSVGSLSPERTDEGDDAIIVLDISYCDSLSP